jgi:ABC-type sugar transport system ATPase subunit
MDKRSNDRRAFLKQGALLAGGTLLMRPNPETAMAEGQAQLANETLKTIGHPRPSHGNFLAKEAPEDQRLRGKLMLREALGSEIVAHFEIKAPPVLTEDTKELAEDIGTGHHYEAHQKRQSTTSKLVGRFNARTEAREGETIEVAVDTRALHFFDVETGLGIYGDGESRVETSSEEQRREVAA